MLGWKYLLTGEIQTTAGDTLKHVDTFTYLETYISFAENDVNIRIG